MPTAATSRHWHACAGWKRCVCSIAQRPNGKYCRGFRAIPPAHDGSTAHGLPLLGGAGVLRLYLNLSLIAVYFGFSYLGVFDFDHYSGAVTMFVGFLMLILASEFYQPLRDFGAFYHAKAQAVGAADALQTLY